MSLPPGPRRPPFLQNLAWVGSPLSFLRKCQARFGSPFTLRLGPDRTAVVFSDPASVRAIFSGSPDVFLAGKAQERMARLLGPNSLLTIDGEVHRRHRRIMTAALNRERMHAYGELTRQLALDDLATWPRGEALPGHERMTHITLKLICSALFGRGEMIDELSELFHLLSQKRYVVVGFVPALQVDLGPWSPWGRFVRLRRRFDELIHAAIQAARAEYAEREDLLARMIACSVEKGLPLSDAELRDELLTLLVAGHDTTASSLAWNLVYITGIPGVQDRLQAELDAVVGGAAVTSEQLERLPYLDAVVQETFRLRSPALIAARWLAKDAEINGHSLPAGTYVYASNYLAHLNPEVFPDPSRFDPERHLDQRPDPFTLFPFGGGVRRCIGAPLALFQIKVVLAEVFQRLRLRPDGEPDFEARRSGLVIVPARGVPLLAEDRRVSVSP